ncbi:MAG: hypothetical protein LC641_01880 [Spirochaeta sp.]|nr:hypothetical protein [Spirochaeta sp.]
MNKPTTTTSNQAKPKQHPFLLIETFSGKVVARACDPRLFKNEIPEKLADNYTLHHENEGWFASATILYKQNHQPNH